VISSLLKIVSLVAVAALLISFGAFVADQAGDSSKQTVAKLADAGAAAQPVPVTDETLNEPNPGPRVERQREQAHPGWREVVDDANDVLVSPFSSLAGDSSLWAQRLVTGLLALLVFGVGIGFLGRTAALRGV
jgi:hypothetical protein